MTGYGSTLDDIRPDIEDVLHAHGVDEIRNGKVKCPYHGESNASASVRGGKFFCFACDVHGDAFDLIMAYENCDLKRAMEIARENFTPAGTAAPARPSKGRKSAKQSKPAYIPRY